MLLLYAERRKFNDEICQEKNQILALNPNFDLFAPKAPLNRNPHIHNDIRRKLRFRKSVSNRHAKPCGFEHSYVVRAVSNRQRFFPGNPQELQRFALIGVQA
jgi:hypothetical protein